MIIKLFSHGVSLRLWSDFSLGKSKISFMKRIKHFFTVGFELCCKLLVYEAFESFVDNRDSHWATWAGRAIPICRAIHRWRTRCGNRLSCLGSYLELGSLVPYFEDWVVCHKFGGPFVWFFNNIHVDAILEVFLHVCIDKEIKTSEIRKRDKLRQWCSLLTFHGLEELEVQITNLLLSNWRLWINRIKPSVSDSVDSILLDSEAGSCEGCLIIDILQCFNE